MAPFATEHKFRTICDWGNWVFPYDDLFDNGMMRNDPNRATVAMDMLIASFHRECELESASCPGMESIDKLVRFHTKIWHSIKSKASPGMYGSIPDHSQNLTRQASDDGIQSL